METNREGWLISDIERECTSCGTIFEITSGMTLCKPCNSNRVKSRSIEKKILQRVKTRSVLKGLEFNLQLEDIIVTDICPILGIPIKENSGGSGAYRDSISLDRIDNSKGYIKGNVQVVSQLANSMKASANIEELQKFADWINQTYPRGSNDTS